MALVCVTATERNQICRLNCAGDNAWLEHPENMHFQKPECSRGKLEACIRLPSIWSGQWQQTSTQNSHVNGKGSRLQRNQCLCVCVCACVTFDFGFDLPLVFLALWYSLTYMPLPMNQWKGFVNIVETSSIQIGRSTVTNLCFLVSSECV